MKMRPVFAGSVSKALVEQATTSCSVVLKSSHCCTSNGCLGIAEVAHRRYTFKRFRLRLMSPSAIPETDKLVARLCLIPKRGFLAEFEDGQCFRLRWTNWH